VFGSGPNATNSSSNTGINTAAQQRSAAAAASLNLQVLDVARWRAVHMSCRTQVYAPEIPVLEDFGTEDWGRRVRVAAAAELRARQQGFVQGATGAEAELDVRRAVTDAVEADLAPERQRTLVRLRGEGRREAALGRGGTDPATGDFVSLTKRQEQEDLIESRLAALKARIPGRA
jgi:hypothetical protein